MSDNPLRELEDKVQLLHLDYASNKAAMAAAIEHLTTAVNGLTSTVQDFRDTINKGKGAVWLFGLLATALGGLVSWVMTRLFQT